MTQYGSIFYDAQARPLTTNGSILPGSFYQFYYSETVVLAPIYADGILSTQLPNPVQADSTGKFPVIYLDTTNLYRVQLLDSNMTLIEDVDPYVASAGGGSDIDTGGAPGSQGPPGTNAVGLILSVPAITVPCDSSGNVLDYGPAQGQLQVFSGTNDVTLSSVLSVASQVNVVGTINTAANVPVNGQPIGFYRITSLTSLTGSLVLQAVYNSVIYTATVVITKAVQGNTGSPGTGTSALSIILSVPFVGLPSLQNGTAPDFSPAHGQCFVLSGTVDVTAASTLSAVPDANTVGSINTATNTPVNGQPKGYYQVTAMSQNVGTLAITAVYSSANLTATFQVTKVPAGYEIVATLPNTNLFNGRMVFLTTTNILYKYVTGTGWVPVVNATDMTGQLNSAQIASIDAAKLTGTLTTTQIGPNTIQTGNLAAASVLTNNLAAGSVTTAILAAGAVTAPKITAGTITSNELAANSVTTNQLSAGAVTAAKIQANSITSAQLSTGLLITNSAQIGNAVIATANMQNLSVTSAIIQDLSIGTTKIADFAVSHLVYYKFQTASFGNPVLTGTFNNSSNNYVIMTDTLHGSGFAPSVSVTNNNANGSILVTCDFEGYNEVANQSMGCRRSDGTMLVPLAANYIISAVGNNEWTRHYVFLDTTPIVGTNSYQPVYMNMAAFVTTYNDYFRMYFYAQLFQK